MKQIKPKKAITALAGLALITVASAFFLIIYRMGATDTKALADFSIAYKQYDQAVADFSQAIFAPNAANGASVDDLEHKANDAMVILNARASLRISSLTRTDGELMKLSVEIAALAADEFDTVMAYQNTTVNKSNDQDLLANQFHDLVHQRQTAYARYVVLLGIKQ